MTANNGDESTANFLGAQRHDTDAESIVRFGYSTREVSVPTNRRSIRGMVEIAVPRLETVDEVLIRHERALQRADRSIAALRRQLAGREVAIPVATPVAAESQLAELIQIVAWFKRDTAALLRSRRWRVGNRLGRIFAPGLQRRRHQLAASRLADLLTRVDGLAATVAATAHHSGHVAAIHTSTHNSWDPWPPARPTAYTVIVLANVVWNGRQQRPHQLARAFAAHNHSVFYLSIDTGALGSEQVIERGITEVEFSPTREYDRYHDIPDSQLVAEWMVAIEALKHRHRIDEAVVHVHLQSWTPFAWELRKTYGWRVIYDCMDEWQDFPGMGDELLAAELDLARGADLVVTTAERLRTKWTPLNPRTMLVRNAVDADFFVDNYAPSDVLADRIHPIIGFTGALAAWIDYRLVAEVAVARPDWTFVFVGDTYVPANRLSGLDRMSNVFFAGLQPYQSMPSYLFAFDVAIIPFVVDRISSAVDPVKFWEYCAAGNPIVTTDLPELAEHHHLFHTASDSRSFEAAVEAALAEDPSLALERRKLACANTWQHRYTAFDEATRQLWPTMSVTIVTFGQLAFTRRCLETLMSNTTYPALEIIVVDNASIDGTARYLRHLAGLDPRVKLVLNDDNRGFAAACNQGLDLATGDLLVLLNNDTELSPGWHVPLLAHLDDPTIGLLGPRSDNVGNGARIDVPEKYAADLDGFCRLLRVEEAGRSFEIKMLAMFCVAMRRDVYEKVGPLDEGYGIGMFEDDDYCERIRAAGFRIVCARDAFVHHVGQATFKTLIATGEYDDLWTRNRQRFESRWGRWEAQSQLFEPVADG